MNDWEELKEIMVDVIDYNLISRLEDEIITMREELHQIPEIGFGVEKTGRYIRKKLSKYGYEFKTTAKNGLIGFKKGDSSQKAVAFRADMDGLELNEKTGLDFSSIHPGSMHGCGHDGHMAILLGLARYISRLKEIRRDIVFIFQPAEESPGGAAVIVDEGILEEYNVGFIFGLHIYPGIEEGKIGIRSGPLTAQSGEVDIDIKAKGSHGAEPHQGKDGIYIASQLIDNYQSIISRSIDPIEGAVLTIGKMRAGTARNAIADNASLAGTIRAFDQDIYKEIKKRIDEINKGMEKAYQVEIDLEIRDFYPPVNNDYKLYKMVDSFLDDREKIEMKPLMIAEDFSYYQKAVPGFFFMLGSRNQKKGYNYPLHNSKFDFSESILKKGVILFLKTAAELNAI